MGDYLTPLTGAKRAREFLVTDIESKDGASRVKPGFTRPFMVGVYDGSRYLEFRDLEPNRGRWQSRYFFRDGCVAQAMRAILTPENEGKHIYAHNAGRFDFLFFLPWLMHEGEEMGFTFTIIPVSSSIQVLDVRKKEPTGKIHKWRFLDSFKLIPTSLDKAAKSFGLAGKVAHDLSAHENDPAWHEYLKQDCVELYRILERFHDYVENVLDGEVGVTAPSTSIKLFRRKYLKARLPRSVDTHDFVREGYFGGRVEVFRTYGEKLRYYDINSSYPRAMLEPMPVGEASHWKGEPPDVLKERIGFIRCDVTVPEDIALPILPVKADERAPKHLNGKLIFPVGRLSGVWEWGELQLAMRLGATVERWHESVWYEGKPIFREFVTDIYKYRDKSSPSYDPGLAEVCKIMLNSAYGKFGMKTLRRQIYRWDDPELPDNAVPAGPDPDCPIWYAEKTVDACYVMPQISARVTALARVRLAEGMLAAIERGGNPYYCDTDSILTDVIIPTSSELGAYKDEYPFYCPTCKKVVDAPCHDAFPLSGHLSGRFLGPKLYVLSAETWSSVKAKGFADRSLKMVERLVSGETVVQDRLEKVGTLARAGFLRGPQMVSVPKKIHPTSGKREVMPDGTTRPWVLEMWSKAG